VRDIIDSEQDEDGVESNFLAAFYSPVDPD
jgi:hypothetical protein